MGVPLGQDNCLCHTEDGGEREVPALLYHTDQIGIIASPI